MLRAGSLMYDLELRQLPVDTTDACLDAGSILWLQCYACAGVNHFAKNWLSKRQNLSLADGVAVRTSHLVHSVYVARTSTSLPRVRETRKGLRLQRHPPPLPAIFNGGTTNRSYGCKRRATKHPSGDGILAMRACLRSMMQKLEEQKRRYNYDER
ncbi:hypothetical protein T4B_7038 [Trichinella pseudospiralis]|nr:hypothetical protein T4B_7038 [Trichinella pseudospiralis]KRZ36617.1 hypothetical protein T4C_2659 [Trichinella pseudospiralis]